MLSGMLALKLRHWLGLFPAAEPLGTRQQGGQVVGGSALLGRNGKGRPTHPFASKEPKPTRARLIGLLDPLRRKRYVEVEQFLATVNGAMSKTHFYQTPKNWGWAVQYMVGSKHCLCTLHFLPGILEATVVLGTGLEPLADGAGLPPDLRRRIRRTRPVRGERWVRLPIHGDSDFAAFQALIGLKAADLRRRKGRARMRTK
jgi:hypothetical protein